MVCYAAAAVAFLVLTLLLVVGWRGQRQGVFLAIASMISTVWAVTAAYHAAADYPSSLMMSLLEVLRSSFWLLFLFVLVRSGHDGEVGPAKIRAVSLVMPLFCLLLVLVLLYPQMARELLQPLIDVNVSIVGQVILAVIGLVLIEQLFRNTPKDQRWAVKFLCFGIGGLFAYDFVLYSDALLVNVIDADLWNARGIVNALVVPLIAISVSRNPQWAVDITVSRRLVFRSTVLFGAGLYLLVMAAGGYYIRFLGGSWGGVAQVAFLSGTVLVLLLFVFSGQLQARLKVFLGKNFYSYKYDYREQWQQFIRTLSMQGTDEELRRKVIHAVANIMESPGGILWQRQEAGHFVPVTASNLKVDYNLSESADGSLAHFLETWQWVVNVNEYARDPGLYRDLDLPEWLQNLEDAWLVVPLMQQTQLVGFLVLARSRAGDHFNWEDIDLLRVAGRQVASYLALLEANRALIDARQFEAFNRLSAFVIHDIKNLAAQLTLVVSNAEKHKHNPQFMEDAITTVAYSVEKMNRLLAQLRAGQAKTDVISGVSLLALLNEVKELTQKRRPPLQIQHVEDDIVIRADRDRAVAIIEHLVQNAQESTPDDGWVKVTLTRSKGGALIEIEDNGSGMDHQFVRERLFRPFDSTKGSAGMGIGVYESREFVQKLGGKIEVNSTLDIGTKFSIWLPAVSANGNESRADKEGVAALL
ncbi:MAG: PEP-CTERM system histidine kinase PrsK [Gammaproteobacteria bacterium]|nr:PEP-CTERM system histidine kinase PrsK [Gammaproteobacteria bacterium]